MTNGLLLGGYTVMSVLGLLLLKLGAPAIRAGGGLAALGWTPIVQVLAGMALYIGAFLLWLVILSRMELSVAYPVAIGLTLVFLSVASVIVLNESITPVHLAGIVLILIGIVLVTRPT